MKIRSVIILSACFIAFSEAAIAQTISSMVVNSTGSSVVAGGIRHDYSFGEAGPLTTVSVSTNQVVTQGFLQPVPPIACSALIPGVISSGQNVCANEPFTLQVSNSSSGELYQVGKWQYRALGTGLWQDIPGSGAALLNHQGISSTTEFRYSVFCLSDSNTVEYSQTTIVTVLPTPVVNLGQDTAICAGSSLILDAGGGAGYTYQWNNGSPGQSITVASGGQYSVVVSNGVCSASDTIQVDVLQAPNPTTITASLINGLAYTFEPATVEGGASYSWDFGDGTTAQGVNVSHTYAQAGTYTVTLEVTNPCGVYTIQKEVDVEAPTVIADKTKDGLRIFPNPTNGRLTVQIDGAASHLGSYTLANQVGQVLISGQITHPSFQIDLEPFASGIYLLVIKRADNVLSKKIHLIR